ncbi:MAG TPA: glycosyltransferase family 4 protein [Solirubrobacteraceae bacterium]|nr:glycosyltransferase family 4 protein [Solirubrobacteraceae bacterium]
MPAATQAATIAIVSVGDPRSPGTWSGVTSGLCAGLRELGVEVVPVDLSLPRLRERALLAAAAMRTRNRYDAEGAALVDRVRSMRARQMLEQARVDGTIQIGTTFTLPAGMRYVTLEDMTLRQAVVTHPVFSRMSRRAANGWERRRTSIYAVAQMCAAATHWTADSLREDYGVPDDRIAVVGFGANHRPSARERDWDTPRFLFVGIDWERKGGPQLLRAFAKVRERIPAATLDVIGGHPPLEQAGVRFHGVLSQQRERDRALMLDLFGAATCFVMPSQVEPFGIVYVEAAAAGVPSIGSNLGGPPDVIGSDGGAVIPAADEHALIEAMLRLADPATARRAGAAARARSALYTWRAVAERLLRALGLTAADGRELAEFL